MSQNLESLSELEAINLMLSTIGESPVSTLEDAGDLNVSVAKQFLHNNSREIQTYGYNFNNECEYPLPVDTEGTIRVPKNILRFQLSEVDRYHNVVQRGERLYDRGNHTYTFTQRLRADITFFLEWDEVPQAARQYITIVAARKFQRRVQGDEAIEKLTAREEFEAKAQMEEADTGSNTYNLKDSDDVRSIIERH